MKCQHTKGHRFAKLKIPKEDQRLLMSVLFSYPRTNPFYFSLNLRCFFFNRTANHDIRILRQAITSNNLTAT